ncbi:uncharacterized protein LOC141901529 [Tubulanus polymorphus]|uniref:uncharacterized protein LOC141901529 n=1 Tax=Tubulanus polymorphus TaxID=672921 RepID=UPI003DA355B1
MNTDYIIKQAMQAALAKLEFASTTEEELDSLWDLRQMLKKAANISLSSVKVKSDNVSMEEAMLLRYNSFESNENPFPDQFVSSLCLNQSDLNKFTSYLFQRRYGWSEGYKEVKQVRIRRMNRINSVVATSIDEVKYKPPLNDVLDDFIKWYKFQDINDLLIEAFKFTVNSASQKPMVRNQTFVHVMEWLKKTSDQLNTDNFPRVESLLITGMTDIWSAIRNICASRLGPVVEKLTIPSLQSFFSHLITVCLSSDSTWQAKEGAITGIHYIVKKLHWTDSYVDAAVASENKPKYKLVLGMNEMHEMPEFIQKGIKQLLYSLLANPQLTIRENMTKAFSVYITKCDFQEAVDAFNDVICHLKNPHITAATNDKQHEESTAPMFIDAFTAEGILGVCLFLVKHIPPSFLLQKRNEYFDTFNVYLMHPASTVRQATSTIFKYLVAHDCNDPIHLKQLLQGLSADWIVDADRLKQSISMETGQSKHGKLRRQLTITKIHSLDDHEKRSLVDAWEWREGRLFAYELILEFLIKNHWFYTFGPSRLNSSIDETEKETEDTFMKPPSSGSLRTSWNVPSPCPSPGVSEMLYEAKLKRRTVVRHTSVSTSMPSEEIPPAMLKRRDSNDEPQTENIHPRLRTQTSDSFRVGSSLGGQRAWSKHFCYYTKSTEQNARSFALLSLAKESDVVKKEPNGDVLTEESAVNTQTMRILLERMLLQTIECLGDSRWEVRRMGQQVLPLVSEVIRWFDMNLLVEFINSHLITETCVMSYGLCVLIKCAVAHAGKLQHLLNNPPAAWQDNMKLCTNVVQTITDAVTENVSDWSDYVHSLLIRPVCDRLSLVAMETLMISQLYFRSHLEKNLEQVKSISDFIVKVFSHSHPEQIQNTQPVTTTFHTPSEGFLSCCIKVGTPRENALQVEKQLLKIVMLYFPAFFKQADLLCVIEMLPVLIYYIGATSGELDDCKTFIESVGTIAMYTGQYFLHQDRSSAEENVRSICQAALKQLVSLTNIKTMDVSRIRQILDIYLVFTTQMWDHSSLIDMFREVCSRVSKAPNCDKPAPDMDAADVAVLTDHISAFPTPDSDSECSSENENIPELPAPLLHESQALNTSNNSGGAGAGAAGSSNHLNDVLEGRIPSPVTHQSDDGGSDWDDWSDDEDEPQSAYDEIFANFLQKLQTCFKSAPIPGKYEEFEGKMKMLPDQERRVIRSLIDMNLSSSWHL